MNLESSMTLKEAIDQYLAFLEKDGKSPRTLYTYAKDCEQMLTFFGADKKLINLLPAHVAKFYQSEALLKIAKTGKDRSPKTVHKTKMVFRGVLIWAKSNGHIESFPLPKNTKIGK